MEIVGTPSTGISRRSRGIRCYDGAWHAYREGWQRQNATGGGDEVELWGNSKYPRYTPMLTRKSSGSEVGPKGVIPIVGNFWVPCCFVRSWGEARLALGISCTSLLPAPSPGWVGFSARGDRFQGLGCSGASLAQRSDDRFHPVTLM